LFVADLWITVRGNASTAPLRHSGQGARYGATATSDFKGIEPFQSRDLTSEAGADEKVCIVRNNKVRLLRIAEFLPIPLSHSPRGTPGQEGSPYGGKSSRLPPQEGFEKRCRSNPPYASPTHNRSASPPFGLHGTACGSKVQKPFR
jgi:hypothetical protein